VITLAQEVLGWQPTVALDQGLARTIAYFRQLIAAEASEPGGEGQP
jgi:UDP-glucuronate decarboxylase